AQESWVHRIESTIRTTKSGIVQGDDHPSQIAIGQFQVLNRFRRPWNGVPVIFSAHADRRISDLCALQATKIDIYQSLNLAVSAGNSCQQDCERRVRYDESSWHKV